jgi:hypothetical protein
LATRITEADGLAAVMPLKEASAVMPPPLLEIENPAVPEDLPM